MLALPRCVKSKVSAEIRGSQGESKEKIFPDMWRIRSKTNQDTTGYFANVFPALNKTFSAKRNISRR